MIVTLCTERIRTLDHIRAFLEGSEAADITPHDREAAYAFIERTLVRFRYHFGLPRAGKGLVRKYLVAKVTGYSDAQLTRLIAQQRRTGHIRDHRLRPSFAALPDGLHDRRRAAAGRGGRGRGPALGTGDEADPVAHVPCLRRRALRTPGGDLERPHLQPAQPPGVPACPHDVPDDAGCGVADRTAAQAPAGGPPGLRARRQPSTAATATARRGPTSSTWSTK